MAVAFQAKRKTKAPAGAWGNSRERSVFPSGKHSARFFFEATVCWAIAPRVWPDTSATIPLNILLDVFYKKKALWNQGHPLTTLKPEEALKKQQAYEWMAAAQVYKQRLDNLAPNPGINEKARIGELLAKCYFKGAFQAQNRQEFKERMTLANKSYKELALLHEAQGSPGLSKRAKAWEAYTVFWLSDNYSDKRNAIRKSIDVAEEALQSLRDQNNRRVIGETERDLLTWLDEAGWLVQEWGEAKDIFERAMKIGPEAIAELTRLGESEELLESLSEFSFFLWLPARSVLEHNQIRELDEERKKLQPRIIELAAKLNTPYARFISTATSASEANAEGDFSKALRLAESLVQIAQETKDTRIIGSAHQGLLNGNRQAAFVEEDLEKKKEVLHRALEAAPIAIEKLEVVLESWLLAVVYSDFAECHTFLALAEVNVEKKKAHLRRAIEVAKGGMIYDNNSSIGHALSKAMYFLANMEKDTREKLQLLRDALPIREDTVRTFDRSAPRSTEPAIMRNYLALIKSDLSDLEPDPLTKAQLLEDAVSDMEKCIEQYGKWAHNPYEIAVLARYQEWYGDIVLRLLRLTGESDATKRAIQVYKDAITNLTKADLPSSMASLQWKVATIHDTLGSYKEASETFHKAAENFRSAARKFPGSTATFEELCSYMEAWSLIETARQHHNEEEYLSASENYAEAAANLERTKAWNYLAPHYTACSHVEAGEALSREEKLDSSMESFKAALNTFQKGKLALEQRLGTTSNPSEKAEIERWLEITNGRTKYCTGRIELEEGKILDRKGDEEPSSTKYHAAAETFKALAREAKTEQGRQELDNLALFCDAWAKMKDAEAEASPQLYSQAAELFSKTKDVATRKRARLLAMANASICRALEQGSQFRLTRDTGLYSEIKRRLETATDYYEQAGLESAAEWARATGKLFDALVCLADATMERESKKRTELNDLAERHLRMAAKLYGEAGFQGKKKEAQRYLKRAREEKELLLSPIEALAEDPTVSGGSVTPVALLRDQPSGPEMFETANVVGNAVLSQKEVGFGSDVVLELEMVNIGKTPATLVKLENIVPEGLGLSREKMPYHIENDYINMKGKTLEHHKTYELKIPIRTNRKGTFELHPRILFVDERGNYRSYEFEPVSLVVTELGLSGWIRGQK